MDQLITTYSNEMDKYKKLIRPYSDLLTETIQQESPVFHAEILRQYNQTVRSILLAELARDTGLDALTVSEFVEGLDLKEFRTYLTKFQGVE